MYKLQKTNHFDQWLRKLKDLRAKAKILARLKRIELGNLGDHKSLGGKLSELRVDYGPGYRVYFTKTRDRMVILLIGGDKSNQAGDIEKARNMIKELGVEL